METIGTLINPVFSGVQNIRVIHRRDYSLRLDFEAFLAFIEELGRQYDPDFVIDKYNKFAYTNIAKWAIGDPTMERLDIAGRGRKPGRLDKGLFLTGETGTGKSLAMELAAKVVRELNFGYSAFRSSYSLSWSSYRSDKIVNYFSQGGDLSALTDEQRVLCVQDLGSEPPEAMYMGTRVNVIRQIIEARSDNRTMITHYTSNISLRDKDRLIGFYGDRAYDRLRECNYLEIAGKSRRG